MIDLQPFHMQFVVTGAVLFALGLAGFLARRNLIVIFLCTEIMFQGVILVVSGFSLRHMDPAGQSFGLLLLVVAAAEAALALALVVLLFRQRQTLDASAFSELRG